MILRKLLDNCEAFEKLAQELSERKDIEEQLLGPEESEPKREDYSYWRFGPGADQGERWKTEMERYAFERSLAIEGAVLDYLNKSPYKDLFILENPRIKSLEEVLGDRLWLIYRKAVEHFAQNPLMFFVSGGYHFKLSSAILKRMLAWYSVNKTQITFDKEIKETLKELKRYQAKIIEENRENIIRAIEREAYIVQKSKDKAEDQSGQDRTSRPLDIEEKIPLDYLVLLRKIFKKEYSKDSYIGLSLFQFWESIPAPWREWEAFNTLCNLIDAEYFKLESSGYLFIRSPDDGKKLLHLTKDLDLESWYKPELAKLILALLGHKFTVGEIKKLLPFILTDNQGTEVNVVSKINDLITPKPVNFSVDLNYITERIDKLKEIINTSKGSLEFARRISREHILDKEIFEYRDEGVKQKIREKWQLDAERFDDFPDELKKIYLKKDFYEVMNRAVTVEYNRINNEKMATFLETMHKRFGINGAKRIFKQAVDALSATLKVHMLDGGDYWWVAAEVVKKMGEAGAKIFIKILPLQDLIHDVISGESKQKEILFKLLSGPINKFDLNSDNIESALEGYAVYLEYPDGVKKDIEQYKLITFEDLENLEKGFLAGRFSQRDVHVGKAIATMRSLRGAKLVLERAREAKKVPEIVNIAYDLGNGFKFESLPDLDIEHLTVGLDTKCCQRIGGEGQEAAIDSMINPLAGVLVLRGLRGEVVAQSYFHWVPEEKMYILDNVESNETAVKRYRINLEMLYAKLANYLIRAGAKRVLAGKSYSDIDIESFKTAKLKEDPRSFAVDYPYTDFDEDNAMDLTQPLFAASGQLSMEPESEKRHDPLTYRLEDQWWNTLRRRLNKKNREVKASYSYDGPRL
jgi:hypothetical protein